MSRRARMSLFAVTSLLVFGVAAGWLCLTYLGVVSKDVRVEASLTSLGDSLGPGSKVRYHGLIVGTVHGVDQRSGHFGAELLINRRDAAEIPRSVVARVLPATLFGSEYVELVGGDTTATASGSHLRSGDSVRADDPAKTVRLMDSFDEADRMLSAVDSQQIDVSLGALAAALDGHGQDVSGFINDADDYVTTMTANRSLLFDDLRLFGAATQTMAGAEPHLVASAANARTTAKTITQQHQQISSLVDSTTKLADRGTTLMADEGDRVVKLLRSTGPALSIVAAHNDDLTKLFDRVPIVVTNGANGIKGGQVQMEGMIGLNPYEPYTAADCTRYGAMVGSNCGNAVPAKDKAQDTGTSSGGIGSADLKDLADTVQKLLAGSTAAQEHSTSPSNSSKAAPQLLSFVDQLLGLDDADGGIAAMLAALAGAAGTP
ncbi:MAG: hypothetical protein JWQ70_890 [Aeromicrobium sp.]|nr:hypothetical protein [Aeromicrobium sp.]